MMTADQLLEFDDLLDTYNNYYYLECKAYEAMYGPEEDGQVEKLDKACAETEIHRQKLYAFCNSLRK